MEVITISAIVAFIGTGAVWITLAIFSAQLISCFRKEYPEEAARNLPLPGLRSPRLILFFLDKNTISLLRDNQRLQKMQRHFIWLVILSLFLPIILFLVVVLFAVGELV